MRWISAAGPSAMRRSAGRSRWPRASAPSTMPARATSCSIWSAPMRSGRSRSKPSRATCCRSWPISALEPLFDHLVGLRQERARHGEPERLGGLEVDHQFEFGRLLDRQIGRLGAVEDLSGVNADLAIDRSEARSIADQAAGSGEFSPLVRRRNGMARCQRYELLAPAVEERIGGDDERAGMQLDEGCEGGVDLAF